MKTNDRTEQETALLEAALLETNAERIRVLLAGDLGALDRYVSDDLIYVSPIGKMQTKPEVFAGFRAGTVKVEHMEIDGASARLYGPVGIVGYRADYRVVDDGETFEGQTRSTAVYYHQDGRWQLVSQHVCPIAGA